MADHQYTVDSMTAELEDFLREQARKLTHFQKPLTFKIDGKGRITDINRNTYDIDLSQLQSFKDHFSDKSCTQTHYSDKYLRVQNWEFEFQFRGKNCAQIILSSHNVTLITSKTQKKEIRDCNFKVVVANKESMPKISKSVTGYLNRLGKRNITNASDNVSAEVPNMISFIKRPQLIDPIERMAISNEPTKAEIDPLSLVNKQGKDLLEKLKQFVTRANLLSFMYEQELSEDGARKMRRLIFPESTGHGKKAFTKNVVESLQKNLVE